MKEYLLKLINIMTDYLKKKIKSITGTQLSHKQKSNIMGLKINLEPKLIDLIKLGLYFDPVERISLTDFQKKFKDIIKPYVVFINRQSRKKMSKGIKRRVLARYSRGDPEGDIPFQPRRARLPQIKS